MKHTTTTVNYVVEIDDGIFIPKNYCLTNTIQCIKYENVHLCKNKYHMLKKHDIIGSKYHMNSKVCTIIINNDKEKQNFTLKLTKVQNINKLRINIFLLCCPSNIDLDQLTKYILGELKLGDQYTIQKTCNYTETYKYNKSAYDIKLIESKLQSLKPNEYVFMDKSDTRGKRKYINYLFENKLSKITFKDYLIFFSVKEYNSKNQEKKLFREFVTNILSNCLIKKEDTETNELQDYNNIDFEVTI